MRAEKGPDSPPQPPPGLSSHLSLVSPSHVAVSYRLLRGQIQVLPVCLALTGVQGFGVIWFLPSFVCQVEEIGTLGSQV